MLLIAVLILEYSVFEDEGALTGDLNDYNSDNFHILLCDGAEVY